MGICPKRLREWTEQWSKTAGYSIRLHWTGWIEIWSSYMIKGACPPRNLFSLTFKIVLLSMDNSWDTQMEVWSMLSHWMTSGTIKQRWNNKIALNRLNWNLKQLHDKRGLPPSEFVFTYIQNSAFWGILRWFTSAWKRFHRNDFF
jgi:hypothetical protein